MNTMGIVKIAMDANLLRLWDFGHCPAGL